MKFFKIKEFPNRNFAVTDENDRIICGPTTLEVALISREYHNMDA